VSVALYTSRRTKVRKTIVTTSAGPPTVMDGRGTRENVQERRNEAGSQHQPEIGEMHDGWINGRRTLLQGRGVEVVWGECLKMRNTRVKNTEKRIPTGSMEGSRSALPSSFYMKKEATRGDG
jgi:hypothetical protein